MELQGNSDFSRPRPEPEENLELFPEPEMTEEEPQTGLFAEEEAELPIGPIDSAIEETAPPAASGPKAACPLRPAASLGACLTELRERHKLTLKKLAEETKIREDYLIALEADDYRSLPQVVYVMGYIRKLCALYGVAQEDADHLTADLRQQLSYELPEDITKTVVDHEVSEENERKLKQLLFLICGTIALIVGALVVLGVWLIVDLRSSATTSKSGTLFNENLLIQLQEPPTIQLQELK